MKVSIKKGSTSNILQIFIADSSSTTGAGLTGVAFNTSGLTAYYHRDTDTTATSMTLVTMTVGTFTSLGFKEIDSTNMPGWYQFCPPNAAFASGANSCAFHLKGVTNMAPLPLEVELVAYDNQDSVRLGLTALPNSAAAGAGGLPTVGTGASQIDVDSSGRVNVGKWIGTLVTSAAAGIPDVNTKNLGNTAQTGRDVGASVLLSAGSGAGQLDFTSGVVKANLAQILGTALTETAGQLAAAFKKFFNIGSPASTMDALTLVATSTNLTNAPTAGDFTAAMKTSLNAATPSATVSDKTGFSLTSAYDPSKTASQAGDAMALTTLHALNLESGTAQAGASATITLRAGASATDNLYVGEVIKIYGGTGVGQSRIITGYVGSTKVATVDRAWATNPDATSTYAVIASSQAKLDSSLRSTDVNSSNLDAAVSSRSTYAGTDTAGTTTLLSRIASALSITTGKVDVNDKTGFALTAGEHTNIATDAQTGLTAQGYTATRAGYLDALNGLVQAIWDKATSALTTVGSIGKLLVDNINATISSRMATFTYTAPDNTSIASIKIQTDKMAFTVANQIDANVLKIAGTTQTARDVGGNVDVAVSTRLASAGYTAPDNSDIAAIKLKTDNIPASPSAVSDIPTAVQNRQEMDLNSTKLAHLDADISSRSTYSGGAVSSVTGNVGGSIGSLASQAQTDVSSVLTTQGYTTARAAKLDDLDAAVSSRLAGSSYAAPDNADIALIKAKTDNLPASPAATGDAMALTTGERASVGTAVWATTTRTLSSLGSLVSDIWANVSRTLTDKTGFSLATPPPTAVEVRTEIDSNSTKLAAIKTKTDQLNFTGANVQAVASIDVPTLASAIAAEIPDPLTSQVPGSYASGTAGTALGKLVGSSVSVSSPVYQAGSRLRIVKGDDYLAVDGRAIEFSGTGWPNLTGATVRFTIWLGSISITSVGVVVTPTGTALVRFDVTSTQTQSLPASNADQYNYYYSVEATLLVGGEATLIDSARCTVVAS